MGALLSLIPFRDWLYAAAIAALAFTGYHYYHKYETAVTYAVTVKAESAAAKAAAAKQVADLTAQHAAEVAAIQEKQNAQLQAAAASSADLSKRLRQYTASRCPVTVLPGATAPAAGGVTGSSSVDDAIAGLISAAAHDNAVIEAERAERDSLTGK